MILYITLFCTCFMGGGTDTELQFQDLMENSSTFEDNVLTTVCQSLEDCQGLSLLQKHAKTHTAKRIRVKTLPESKSQISHLIVAHQPVVLLSSAALILLALCTFIFCLIHESDWLLEFFVLSRRSHALPSATNLGAECPPAQRELLQTQNDQQYDLGEVEVEDSASEAPIAQDSELEFHFSFRKLWRYMGPGLLMSLTYLDPGSLTSDVQQGAYTGFSLVWALWWATVVGLILQEMSARLGVVTGKDLAQHVKAEYPSWLTYTVYFNMEIAVITADIQEIVGSAIAIFILSDGKIPLFIGCLITGVDTFTFLAVHYFGIRYLEALMCILTSGMCASFFINLSETGVDAGALAKGWIVPTMPMYATTQAVSIIGAIMMPHNLYLHSGLVLSRKINRSQLNKVREATTYNFLESGLALLASFFINLAIVATNAGQFFSSTCAQKSGGPYACLSAKAADPEVSFGSCDLPHGGIGRCSYLGLQSEGHALQHGVGDLAMYVWAFGLLAAGQASTMTSTYAGQIIMAGFLEVEIEPWKRIALCRALALGPSVIVTLATVGNATLFSQVNEWINVIQSLQLPFAILPLMCFCSKDRIMHHFTCSSRAILLNAILIGIVLAANAVLIVQFSARFTEGGGTWYICLLACVYLFLCVQMIKPR